MAMLVSIHSSEPKLMLWMVDQTSPTTCCLPSRPQDITPCLVPY